ncbi:MAG: hypothetical protein LBD28_00870, partial [Tannerellaceae bacterium]|nr:hypothetical protein [Tannerellaceae bacterium]
MKRSTLVCLLMCLISLLGMAQVKNVDVDNFNLAYLYRGLPTQPQNPISFGYTTKVVSLGVAKNYVSLEEIADAMFIEGQTRIGDPEEALLNVELALGNIVIKSSDVRERKVEDKDKNGNVTKTTYYYKAVVEYNYEAAYRVYKEGKMLKTGSALGSSNFKFESDEYGTRKAAADFWNNNKETHISNFYIRHAREALAYLNTTLSDLYG